MSFIQRELEKLNAAIRIGQIDAVDAQLRAAQQALAWAMEPQGFASPYDAIARSNDVRGTQEDSEDYSLPPRHPVSSDICVRTG